MAKTPEPETTSEVDTAAVNQVSLETQATEQQDQNSVCLSPGHDEVKRPFVLSIFIDNTDTQTITVPADQLSSTIYDISVVGFTKVINDDRVVHFPAHLIRRIDAKRT